MKELYLVSVYGDSMSRFEEYYSEEEIKAIEKITDDMKKHGVANYDIPCIEFEKK